MSTSSTESIKITNPLMQSSLLQITKLILKYFIFSGKTDFKKLSTFRGTGTIPDNLKGTIHHLAKFRK